MEGHFYTQGMPDNAVLYLQKDGQWVGTDAETDGSYLVAEISCGQPFRGGAASGERHFALSDDRDCPCGGSGNTVDLHYCQKKEAQDAGGQAAAESAASEEKQPVADDDTDDGAEEDTDGLLEIPEIEVEDAPEETAGEENSDDR